MTTPTFNLADLFEIVADAVPDRECLVCDTRRLTYRRLEERSNRLAHALAARGVGPGDHVGLHLSNGTEYLESMLAAFKLRAVPVNVNYRYVAEELRYLLTDADVVATVVHRAFVATLSQVVDDLPRLRAAIVVEDGTGPDEGAGALGPGLARLDPTEYEAALAAASPARDFATRSPDDRYILYTGGTTGMPKGVVWRQEDAFFAAFGGGNPGGPPVATPGELAGKCLDGRVRSLPASPFMHGTAHWVALAALYGGGTVVVCPDRHFDAERLWRLVAREQVSFLTIVGDAFGRPMADALRTLGGELDVGCCRVILSGGAILSPSTKHALAELLPGTLIVDGYGASETGGQGQGITAAGAPASGPRFTVNDETAILDEDLRPVSEPGVVGRLARRGHVPLGYHGDPEKTAATFPVIDGERWAVPGDFAVLETDGTITMLGRGSVSINTGGEKVYPEEVEAVLKGHASVVDAVVVGVPDDRWGERVVAVVQAVDGTAPTLDDLVRHARDSLAGYKLPRELVLVDTVQRAPSGKADYRWAREIARESLTPR